MRDEPADELDPEVEATLDDRWTYDQTPLGRTLFYVALAMLGAVGLARWTGHMDLVTRNADLIAMVGGAAGFVWILRDARRGVTRFGRHGYWEVRRDEHPVGFWFLIVLYGLAFAGMLVGGVAHRAGWLTL